MKTTFEKATKKNVVEILSCQGFFSFWPVPFVVDIVVVIKSKK